MPSLTSPPPSKKRRFPDSDAPEALAVLPSPQLWEKPAHHARWGGGEGKDIFFPGAHHVGAEWGVPRKIVPLPSAKRARLADEERRRSAATRLPSGGGVTTTTTTTRDGAGKQSRMCLAACHICHRRPTKKTAMDSFADCEGCGERACFVCIRECMGPSSRDGAAAGDEGALSRSFCMDDAPEHRPEDEERKDEEERRDKEDEGRKGWAGGHKGVVCSRCCIEMGPDGEIACLGCLSRMEGG
ncbi:uncharacterized protein DNG_03580 [Cephalotrichum gorgonifer]|uniref:Uncharacterized protein n=1 Tax=Cephalotrichum gorgonifer TaxID=2041049 RepID=A0AAE8MWE7_9PEZI|nr:uncharacterized protein DNG_03580 [Cephalotrichum gorgonifer]